jgi:hypothetical protein
MLALTPAISDARLADAVDLLHETPCARSAFCEPATISRTPTKSANPRTAESISGAYARRST